MTYAHAIAQQPASIIGLFSTAFQRLTARFSNDFAATSEVAATAQAATARIDDRELHWISSDAPLGVLFNPLYSGFVTDAAGIDAAICRRIGRRH